jgi:WD40 repeat protein
MQPLFSVALDRQLTPVEIRTGLAELPRLLGERAPVLQPRLAKSVEKLEPLLDTDVAALSTGTRQERETALREVNKLCQETVEITFNALAQGEKPPIYDVRQPFRGLSPFRSEDREFFFGRKALVDKLQQKLNADPLLPVLGPSGSGKSSLVLAGLIPALRCEDGDWVYMRPGSDPVRTLERTLEKNDRRPLLVADQFEELFTLCKDEDQRRAFIEALLKRADEGQRLVLTMRADFWGECAPYTELKERMQAQQELVAPMNTAELRAAMEQQAAKVGLRFEADLSNSMLDEVAGEPGAMPLLQHALLELWKRRHGRWLRAAEYRAIGGVKQAIAETAERLYSELPLAKQKRIRDIFIRLTQLDENVVQGEGRRDTRRRLTLTELVPSGSDPEETKALVKLLADAVLVVTSWNEVTQQEEVEVAHEALIRNWGKLGRWLNEDLVNLRLRDNISEAAKDWAQRPEDESMLLHRGSRLAAAEALLNIESFPVTEKERRYVEACTALSNRQREQLAALAEAAQQRAEAERGRAEQEKRMRLQSVALYLATHVQLGLEPRERALLLARQAYLLDRGSGNGVTGPANAALRAALERPDTWVALRGHGSPVTELTFSPDSRLLASAESNGVVRLWDLTRLDVASTCGLDAPYRDVAEEFHNGVQHLCFRRDGRLLAVLDGAGEASTFEIGESSGPPALKERRKGFPKSYWYQTKMWSHVITFDPEGNLISDGEARYPNSVQELVRTYGLDILGYDTFRGGEKLYWDIVASPDRRHLFVATKYPGSFTSYLWKLDSPTPWREELLRGSGSARFSGDNRRLFVVAAGRFLGWDLSWPPTPLLVPHCRRPGTIESIAVDQNGRTIAFGYGDGEIWVWRDSPDSTSRVLLSFSEEFDCFVVHPDGRDAAVWQTSGRVSVHDLRGDRSSGVSLPQISGHSIETLSAVIRRTAYEMWESEGSSAGRDHEFWLRAERSLRIANSRQQVFGLDGRISKLIHLPDGVWAIANWDSRDSEKFPTLIKINDPIGRDQPIALEASTDGNVLVAATGLWGIRVFEVRNLATLPIVRRICGLQGPSGDGRRDHRLLWAAFGQNCDVLVAQEYTRHDRYQRVKVAGSVFVWNLRTPDKAPFKLPGLSQVCTSIALSRDSRYLALGLPEMTFNCESVSSRYPSKTSDFGDAEEEPFKSEVLVYDLKRPEGVLVSLSGQQGDVTAASFSLDGTTLAVGSSSGRIALFSLAARRLSPVFLDGHTGPMLSLIFDSGGRLISISADRTIRSWIVDSTALADAVCKRVSRNLSEREWADFVGEDIPYEWTCDQYHALSDLRQLYLPFPQRTMRAAGSA